MFLILGVGKPELSVQTGQLSSVAAHNIGTLPQILTALQQNLPRQAPDDCQVPETIWFREEWDVLPQYLGIP